MTLPEPLEPLSPVKRALLEIRELKTKLAETERAQHEPIAVIGMGLRWPGGAHDPESAWQLLRDGIDAISEVPKDRWNIDDYYDPNPDAPGKMSTRWAGFINDLDQFDADFFGISPREATSMDPQQRLLMKVAWEALENAGHAPEKLVSSATGVFVGVAAFDYTQMQLQHLPASDIDAYLATGSSHSVCSGRLSYFLGLQGPSISLDTACSSSLVSVHLACQSLRSRECDMALAGGVNLIIIPELLINFSKSHMMAADGRCKTFDARADGFVRGEGAGLVVLKRLSDALANNDNILAVIRGSAINQDGRSSGLTAPNGPSQQAVIRQALRNAAVAPHEVGYIETHGTGTALGDPIEVQALGAVLREGRAAENPVMIGSIKTNLGHLETAAGVAGLIKAVLALQHQEIPPHLHLKELSPHIAWKDLPVTVPTQRTPWQTNNGKRIAGVSSFGFSGTNVHVVIEEWAKGREGEGEYGGVVPIDIASSGEEASRIPPLRGARGVLTVSSPTNDIADRDELKQETLNVSEVAADEHTPLTPLKGGIIDQAVRPLHLLNLSAKTETALQELAQRYEKYFAENSASTLADVCYSANAGRSHFDHRLSLMASSKEHMREKLASFISKQEALGVYNAWSDGTNRPEAVFLFTGQGGQYSNMGKQLFETQPTFRKALQRCDEILRAHLEKPLLSVLYPKAGERSPLDDTNYTQPATFALQYALAELWRSWGVAPGLIMGHSVGEIVAATVAGMMSLEDGLMIVSERGRLMHSLPRNGLMASILADDARVLEAIAPYVDRVAIAAINGPESTVISGERTAVLEILRKLEASGIKTRPLQVSNSFHSPLVEPVLDEFEASCRRAQYQTPTTVLFSSMRLDFVTENSLLDAAYWRHNLRYTVRYSEAMQRLHQLGYRVFVEMGPAPILVVMGQKCYPNNEGVWLPSLRNGREDWEQMLESLATLYVNGVKPDWEKFDRDYARRRVVVPTYPFQEQRFWIDVDRSSKIVDRGSLIVDSDKRSMGYNPQSTIHDPQTTIHEQGWPSIIEAARRQSQQIPFDMPLHTYPAKWQCLDRLATAYIVQALRELRAFTKKNEKYALENFLQRFNILPAYKHLVQRWLNKLVNEGVLVREGELFTNTSALPKISPGSVLKKHGNVFAEIPELLEYVQHCGKLLAPILTGKENALETLFPGGANTTSEFLYHKWALSRYYASIARAAVAAIVSATARDSHLKLLEVGAGTGGTTAAILPVLPKARTEYYFTDMSEYFFTQAAERFAAFPFLRYGILNIENQPHGQGYGQHEFDVVVAANVLHATKNLRATIDNVLTLLKPGGALVLYETTHQPAWFDVTIALIEGWQRFEDGLRNDIPLLPVKMWESLLREHGFEQVAVFPEAGAPTEMLNQHVFVAQASLASGKHLTSGKPDLRTKSFEAYETPEAQVRLRPEFSNGKPETKPAEERVQTFLREIEEAPANERLERLIDYVRGHVTKVLRRERSNPIGRTQRLMDLGIDSLMAVELRNLLATGLGLANTLPATLIFDYPNIEAIAKLLEKKVFGENEKAVADKATLSTVGNVRKMTKDVISELSEEEVEKMLEMKLDGM